MKKLTKFLVSIFTGVMLLGMTAFATEYSVTPANAVFYTNGETVVLADAAADAQVILPGCEAGLPIQVTGVTSNGYWQIVLGDATYYVVGAGLSQTAESAAEVNTSTPAQPVTKSYNIILKKGYSWVDTVVSSYEEACEVAAALGYPLWQIVDEGEDNVWYYGFFGSGSMSDKETFEADFYNTMWQCESIIKSRGYSPYPFGEPLKAKYVNTKDGRIYIPNSSGSAWCLTEYRKAKDGE